jgi:hypothetical protein
VEDILRSRESNNISLAVIRPASIMGCRIVGKSKAEMKEAELRKRSIMAQLNMLTEKQDLELIPFRFVLEFQCDDRSCKGHKFSILDWEISELYRKKKHSSNCKEIIIDKVMNSLCGEERDLPLFGKYGTASAHILYPWVFLASKGKAVKVGFPSIKP